MPRVKQGPSLAWAGHGDRANHRSIYKELTVGQVTSTSVMGPQVAVSPFYGWKN